MGHWFFCRWRLFLIFLHVVRGVTIVAFAFRFLGKPRRQALVVWWSRVLLRLANTTLVIDGDLIAGGSKTMLVVNHISWIDIYIVNALRAARFVAKSELRSWPLIGYLCVASGTIFIERGRRRAVLQANQAVSDALREGDLVVVFPEGTTSYGKSLLPFHSNLIEAALVADAAVQPASLRYTNRDGNLSMAAGYVDDISLVDCYFAMLRDGPITAHLKLLPPITGSDRDRHAVAVQARAAIAASLGIDIGGTSPGSSDPSPVQPR